MPQPSDLSWARYAVTMLAGDVRPDDPHDDKRVDVGDDLWARLTPAERESVRDYAKGYGLWIGNQ